MFIRVHRDSYGGSSLGAPGGFDTGGMAFGADDASYLLEILEGPSPYQPYLKRAMASRAKTLPKGFFRVVTSVESQVPKHLQHLFRAHDDGRMTGGTIDRSTRTIYVREVPGFRFATRLEYAIHEGVHLFAHPHVPAQNQCTQGCVGTFQGAFGTGFGEGLTQVITEDLMKAQRISLYSRDRPYKEFTPVVRALVAVFGRDAVARAYFFGEVEPLRTSMDERWGLNWHSVLGKTNAKQTDKALAQIKELEAAYRTRQAEEAMRLKKLQDLIRNSPRGDFPTPNRERSIA